MHVSILVKLVSVAERCVCFICSDAVHLKSQFSNFSFSSVSLFSTLTQFSPLELMDDYIAVCLNAKASCSSSFDFVMFLNVFSESALRSRLATHFVVLIVVLFIDIVSVLLECVWDINRDAKYVKFIFYLLPLVLCLDVLYRN